MTTDRQERKGGFISLTIGMPVGLAAIIYMLLQPEDLAALGMVMIYGYAIVALAVSFLFALWYGGRRVVKDLRSGKKLIKVSFRYSLIINVIIWSSFSVVVIISNVLSSGGFSFFLLLPALFVFLLSAAGTPFTIGLLICFSISKALKIPGRGQ